MQIVFAKRYMLHVSIDAEFVLGALHSWSNKKVPVYFLNSFVKHWPILTIFACDIKKKLDANNFSFGHFTFTLSLLCEMQS